MTNNELFTNRCYGLTIIKSELSNFNADFTKKPRRLPDHNGTIYATDKALKYAIRKYWKDHNEEVFVWKTFKENKGDYIPKTLEERYESFNAEKPEDAFQNCIDVKSFGITFAMQSQNKDKNKNLSLTGPLQISYGVNKYKENISFINDILSPYRDKKDAKSSTLGNESKSLKTYYVYDFSLNPKNISDHYEKNEDLNKKLSLTNNDISSIKDALKYGVTNLDTTTKKDSENALLLFITFKENSKAFLPAMKNLVEVKNGDNGKIQIDLTRIKELLDTKNDEIESIELYYNKFFHNIHPENLENWTINDNL